MNRTLAEKDAIRSSVLRALYEVKDGGADACDIEDVVSRTALPVVDIETAIEFLSGASMVERLSENFLAITSAGVSHYEDQLRAKDPRESTIGQSRVIQTFHHANIGVVQTGAHSNASVTQRFGADRATLSLLTEIRERIAAGDAADTALALKTTSLIELELRERTPNSATLQRLWRALESILTGAAANLLAAHLQNLEI